MPSRRPRVLVLMLPLLLNSCVTYGLWGYEWRQDPDSDEGHYVAVQGTEWQWWRVLLRIVVTPVTAVADVTFGLGKSIVTFDWLAGDDEEEEDGISFSWVAAWHSCSWI